MSKEVYLVWAIAMTGAAIQHDVSPTTGFWFAALIGWTAYLIKKVLIARALASGADEKGRG
jgi:hypothetical protein